MPPNAFAASVIEISPRYSRNTIFNPQADYRCYGVNYVHIKSKIIRYHEYPYRDTAMIEDIGRSVRKLTLHGFIVQDSLLYSASDVMTQRDLLVAACETLGPGTLVHPTLGELTVSIPDGGLQISESIAGRVFEFTLTVIESGLKVFAITSSVSAVSTVNTSWLSLAAKTAATFISEVSGDLRTVTQALRILNGNGGFWTAMVDNVADQATNLSNTLKSTFGSTRYGRYNDGTVGGSSPVASPVLMAASAIRPTRRTMRLW